MVRSFDARQSEGTPGFLNDVTVNPNSGDAYITDSFVPILWRVPAGRGNPPALHLESSIRGSISPALPIQYVPNEFNLNGIVATPDGRYLLTVQSNTGNLYRIDTQTKQVTLVDLGDETLTNGDGLVLTGHTLYVIRNQGSKHQGVRNQDLSWQEVQVRAGGGDTGAIPARGGWGLPHDWRAGGWTAIGGELTVR